MAIDNTKIAGVSPSEVPVVYKYSKLSLTFGIMSLLLLPIFAAPGFILGLIAASKEKPARRFYVPGIVTSLVSFALVVLVFILVRVLFAIFGLSFGDLRDIDYCMQVIADFFVSHS